MSWKGNAPPKGVLVTRGATVNPLGDPAAGIEQAMSSSHTCRERKPGIDQPPSFASCWLLLGTGL